MKLKNILFIAIAILTIGLFVACNDEVVATKDNNVAYTQVLESNGAFEYNGTKYETLQDAIEAIDKAKGYASKTIKVLRDVNSDGATVPATTVNSITLDLNGKTLSFLTSTGVTVNGVFRVTGNGVITLDDKSADATAFVVGKGGNLAITDTTFNVADQYAVKAAGQGAEVTFGNKAAVAGNIAASDSAKVTLANGSEVSGTLSASDDVTAVSFVDGSKVSGDIFITSGADLTSNTAQVSGSILVTGSGSSFTANKNNLNADLAMADKAEVTVQENGRVHIVAFADTCTVNCSADQTAQVVADADVTIPSSRIKNGFCYVVNASTGEKTYYSLLSDAISAVSDGGTITYVLNHTYSLADYTTVSKNITIDLNGCKELATKLSVNTAGKTLTIKNTNASAGSSITGNLGNNGAGNITIDNVTVGLTTDEVADAVNITGALISTRSTFNATVIAGTLTDGEGSGTEADPYENGSTFNGTVNVSGNITLKKSIIAPLITGNDDDFVRSDGSITMYNVAINNEHVGVFAAQGGSVSMTNSTGIAYKIIATNTGSNLPNTVTINNSNLTSGSLTVVDEVASRVGDSYYGNVSITGRSTDSSAVNVDKIDAAAITISHATVTNTNQGQSGARARSGNFISDNCVFNSVVEVFGSGNNLTDGDKTTEKKGSTFKNGISVVNGSASFYSSTFNPSVNETQYTSFSADSVTIKKSVFSTRTDVGHEGETTNILYNITADKTVSSLSSNTNATNLTIENSTGYVGSLNTTGNTTVSTYSYSSDILVDNSSISSGTLSVGAVSSTNAGNTVFGDVTVKGNSPTTGDDPKSRAVTVASIPYAYDVKTSYAVVAGNIGSDATKVATVSDGWTENSNVGKSEFNGNIYASGAGTFNNSIFAPTSSGATAGDKNLKALSLSISESTFTKTGTTPTYVYSLEATKEFAAASNAISISSSNGSIGTVSASNAGNISIVSTTGVIGNITSSATKDDSSEPTAGSIVIDNSSFSGTETVNTLSTGSLSSLYAYNKSGSGTSYTYSYVYGDVTVKGGTTTNTVTVASIPYADDVKTSYAVVSGDIGYDTTKVKTVSDGWTDSSTVAGYSTFNGNIYASGAGTFKDSRFSASGSDKTLTARNVTINRGVFTKDSSDNRYNVNDSSNTDGGVTINDSTGYLGSVKSDYVITISNKNATDDLYINYRTSDENKYAIYANGHSIHITGPNASGKKIDITGQIRGGVNVNMYAGGTDYDDSSLIVNNIEDRVEIVGPTINIYGGTYYGTGNYAILSGDVNVHKGTFYVGSGEDTALRSVAGNIVNNTDYTVVIKISGNITLSAPLVVGLKNASSFNISPEKNVYFESATGYSYSIKALYNDSDSYATTHYTTVPVVLAGGRIVFNKIRVSLDTCTVETTLNYSYSGSSAFWWKNNGVTVVKATGEETFENPHEFTNNSEIHWNAQ